MIHIKAPHCYSVHLEKKSVFLAGSIEMGAAENWQEAVVEGLRSTDLVILNPRRDDWNVSWVQSIDNPHFREQVEWELDALDAATFVAFYFSPGTKSPITLMELGLHVVKNSKKLIVCCPEGFWRKGNVDILCARYGVRQVKSLEQLETALRGLA